MVSPRRHCKLTVNDFQAMLYNVLHICLSSVTSMGLCMPYQCAFAGAEPPLQYWEDWHQLQVSWGCDLTLCFLDGRASLTSRWLS